MTKLKLMMSLLAGLGLIGLSSCTRTVMSGDEMVAMCQMEVAPAGTYTYEQGQAIPVMVAVEDGTERGARAFNACIRAKAVDSGIVPLTSANGVTGAICPDGAPTIYGGATYCIANY